MIVSLKFPWSYRSIRMVLIFALYLFVPIIGFSQSADSFPDGEGKSLISSKCISCHALSTVLVKRASQDVWDETVNKMVSEFKAPINQNEIAVIVNYLATNFGEDSSNNPGQEILAEQCFRCHGDGMWKDLKTDHSGWLSVIYRMVGRGGKWTPDQINILADHLSETYQVGASK
ncbi:MAG: hypothetical protein ACKVHQ_05320 [Gammaproteobacteria bacterium]|jgi:hypothetical protein